MEPEFLRPDTDHPPPIEEDDAKHDSVKHDFCGETEAWRGVSMGQVSKLLRPKCHGVVRTLLNSPECPDAGELSSNTDDKKVCES